MRYLESLSDQEISKKFRLRLGKQRTRQRYRELTLLRYAPSRS
nr:MAG TPA: hypothetical protein [Caudoviricetes sp.]